MLIRPYTPGDFDLWNDFVSNSRNATFIHDRNFMDYHSDRFMDASVLMFDDKEQLLALFPATINGEVVSSHAGLTYGGWLLGASKPTILQLIEGWRLMLDYYRGLDARTLLYKAIPHIYTTYPSEEDQYLLFRSGAVIESVLISSVLDLSNLSVPFNSGAMRHVKKNLATHSKVSRVEDLSLFWNMLIERLDQRYHVSPVHSLDEIQLLQSRFPENIQLWTVSNPDSGVLLGGTLLFISGPTVKCQYIASSEQGRECNALDYLFYVLIDKFKQLGFRYFDLGPSCEQGGRVLNTGLVNQKLGYGARAISYTTYRLSL